MIQLTFRAANRAALHREIQAYLEPEMGPGALTSSAGAEEGADVDLLRELIGRIPHGRVARDVLRDTASATVKGEVAGYEDLVDRHADGNGKRFGGLTQSIKKAEIACDHQVYDWDPVRRGFRVPSATDARAIIELLDAQ